RQGLRVRATADARGDSQYLRSPRGSRATRARVRHGVRFWGMLRMRRAHQAGVRAPLRRRAGPARGRTRNRGYALTFLDLADPVINASGTFDAIAARRVFGDELLERFP